MKPTFFPAHPTLPLFASGLVLSGLMFSCAALAAPAQGLLEHYATAAEAESQEFKGFSAAKGEALHRQQFDSGKPETPACTSCHGTEPERPGKTLAGKAIEPMALSLSPKRYSDPAKVEKWFKRNCNEVLGRACTAQEKGDWLSFMLNR